MWLFSASMLSSNAPQASSSKSKTWNISTGKSLGQTNIEAQGLALH